MDRSRFRLFGYHTSHTEDGETEVARRSFDQFSDKLPFNELCTTILGDRLDVLIYPGLGMDQDTWQMAALRLAPIQCTSWGHPITSGLPTIDYFLSSDLMEPENAAEHYCETLVRLPNLSIHYTKPDAKSLVLRREDFGLAADAVVYFCPQSLQKYLPQNDALLIEIARRVPSAKFVFLANGPSAVSAFLMDRLHRAFAQANLIGTDHLLLIAALDSDQFQAMSQIVDVLLDTPDWSGCNSSLELLAHGLPVVTLPGEFMRGRHTMAILRMMAMEELIANTPEAYVDLAVRLGSEPVWRKALQARIQASYPQACGDMAAVRGLEQFLESAVARYQSERQTSAP
jgi:predicted O-linked N-acetylglucosamine transferase (SPINDLY family)